MQGAVDVHIVTQSILDADRHSPPADLLIALLCPLYRFVGEVNVFRPYSDSDLWLHEGEHALQDVGLKELRVRRLVCGKVRDGSAGGLEEVLDVFLALLK